MKILLISNELSYRGTPRFLVNCAKIAKAAGHEVAVWALETGGAAAEECAQSGIPVTIGIDRITDVEAFSPDVVHIHRSGGVSYRDNSILRRIKDVCRSRIMETNVFGTADLTINSPIDIHARISRWCLWRWRRWFWPIRRAGIYLPYCVDTDAIRPLPSDFRKRHGIPNDAILIGRLGKTDWRELSRAVVPAMEKVTNIFFATVNDYSGSSDATNEWPESVRERIVRIPALKGPDELSAFYSACDATLNFSPIGESFGFVVAEAMACGTPCIAHSKPRNDNAQIEVASLAAGGFPVRDAAAAEKTILEIAANPPNSERKKICRKSIIERYSLKRFSPTLLKAYSILSESKETGRRLEHLFRNTGMETDIPESEIHSALGNVIGGRPSFVDRMAMKLAYSLPNAIRIHRIVLRGFPSKPIEGVMR